MSKSLVSTAAELNDYLKEKYGDRLTTDLFGTLHGRIDGKLDDRVVSIAFAGDHFLVFSTTSNSKEVLDELLPTLTEVMGNESPICSYDIQSGNERVGILPTIEWDIFEPEKRIKEIVNGRAFNGENVTNLELYGDRKVDDYLESEEEKAERIKNAKIHGVYPGSIKDVEKINSMGEVDLYLSIDAMGSYLWFCNHEMSHGRMPLTDLKEEEYALEYMVYQTRRFGVELPEPEIDKVPCTTPSYTAWHQFYSNHFKNVLTKEQWDAFQQALANGQDTSEFMPSGNWKDSLEESSKSPQKAKNSKTN